jgi:glucosamine-6-phosphate deaminase
MKSYYTESLVEKLFRENDVFFEECPEIRKIPTITVDNYVVLGQLTALRFLEWVCHNPGGVVALPTGSTPAFFIKWLQHYIKNWDQECKTGILGQVGLANKNPDFKSLHFFQLDEFFPINPEHERSFSYFVKNFYLDVMGFDPKKTRQINTYAISSELQKTLGKIHSLEELFSDGIDLSLRIKKPTIELEKIQQKAIRLSDEFCQAFEDDIRNMGGIGFFLGGIGPDGHVAFNVAGSSHNSHTRLTRLNYESEAAAAGDLGGMEMVQKKAVITMGLETITYNPDNVAIIIAAGQSKSKVVTNAIEKNPQLLYPATALQKLPNARFFITRSTCSELDLSAQKYEKLFHDKIFSEDYPERLVVSLCLDNQSELKKGVTKKLEQHPKLMLAEKLSGEKVADLMAKAYDDIDKKIEKGLSKFHDERFFHTGPHHDDIELAYFPLLHHLVRSKKIENNFVYCTSGFSAVTNDYLRSCFESLVNAIDSGRLEMIAAYKKLFNKNSGQDDITGYLSGVAFQNKDRQSLHIGARMARRIAEHLNTKDINVVRKFIHDHIDLINTLEIGRPEPSIVSLFKGWIREFEAELAWGHFGIEKNFIHHLNLPLQSKDVFPQAPDFDNDVMPILNLLRKTKPTIITLALDPEGSGADTHFKVLIALSEAIDKYATEHPEIPLQIWGYRNVMTRFKIHEVDMIVPVSLNSFGVLHNMFNSCFLSQKTASFPSPEYDGMFSELAQKIWVQQHKNLCKLMGDDYFYDSDNPMKRRSYGAIYIKTMSYKEFSNHMAHVRRLLTMKEKLKYDN